MGEKATGFEATHKNRGKNMHAEPQSADAGEPLSDSPNEESFEAAPRRVHNIMDVLFPAKPPEPKNPRVIRLFDTDPVKPEPVQRADGVQKAQQERKSRDEARALRNRSLLAAAGFR
jgi:hypothetical protein